MQIEIKCTDNAVCPQRAHPTDAGADLRSTTNESIAPGTMKMVDTGVAIRIPEGYAGLVVPRSSMGKPRISLANTIGVIDSDYRGTVKALLVNEGTETFEISAADTRIAQLLIIPVQYAEFVPFKGEDQWESTVRGTGGFGSTGK